MNFGEAQAVIVSGGKAVRAGWNGKGMYIFVITDWNYNQIGDAEFQCIYSATTANDYQAAILPKLQAMFERLLGNCSIVESDRLPAYSLKTMDIERGGMELASVSLRTDFSENARVLEIAIGLDRVVSKHVQ